MHRRWNRRIKDYKNKNLRITTKQLVDDYATGGWCSSYDYIKFGYIIDENRHITYGDNRILIYNPKYLIGYLYFADIAIDYDNKYLTKGNKVVSIIDYAIYTKSYVKYSKEVFNYLIKYCKRFNIHNIVVYKNEKYRSFLNFIKRVYKPLEDEENLYIKIDDVKTTKEEKYLTCLEKDSISVFQLYYLYGLNFKVTKRYCIKKLNDNEEIRIDRRTNKMYLPSNVKTLDNNEIYLDDRTIYLVHYLCSMYHSNQIEDVLLNVKLNSNNNIIIDGIVKDKFISYDDIPTIMKDSKYKLASEELSIDKVESVKVKFDLENFGYYYVYGIVDIKKQMR